jgi:hypothetical protein
MPGTQRHVGLVARAGSYGTSTHAKWMLERKRVAHADHRINNKKRGAPSC